MYAMVGTLPNIGHAVGVLNIYMVTLGKEHLIVVKRVFRYLPLMTYIAIFYHENYEEVGVQGVVNSD